MSNSPYMKLMSINTHQPSAIASYPKKLMAYGQYPINCNKLLQ
ncbi:hypothetical protein [Okeania sp. SIO1I7]|nr:hypothetical protein [Okeania sp. SIO1I7]